MDAGNEVFRAEAHPHPRPLSPRRVENDGAARRVVVRAGRRESRIVVVAVRGGGFSLSRGRGQG